MSFILILALVLSTIYFAVTVLIWFVALIILMINGLFGLSLRNNVELMDKWIFWLTLGTVVVVSYFRIDLIGTMVFMGLCFIYTYFKVYREIVMRHNDIPHTDDGDDDDRSYVSLRH